MLYTHGGALLAFELATDSYFLLSRTFVTFSSTLLSFMKAHVVSLAWGLVVRAAVIERGRTFDTRLFAFDFWDPTTFRQFPPDFAIKLPTYFLASVMLVMFLAIRFNDSYDWLDDENSLTLSPVSLLRQSILFMAGSWWSWLWWWSWWCTTWWQCGCYRCSPPSPTFQT